MKGMISEVSRIEICGGIASGKTTLANLLDRTTEQIVLRIFQITHSGEPFTLTLTILLLKQR